MAKGICLGFESARDAWRRVGQLVAEQNPPSERTSPLLVRLLFDSGRDVDTSGVPTSSRVTKPPTSVDAATLRAYAGSCPASSEPLHLCVSRRAGRRFVAGAACHLMSGSYPIGSFCRIVGDVYVASPELAFVQMSRVLDPDLLVAYGYELCGYFARTDDGAGFCNCPPLTNVARITRYLDRLQRLRDERGEGLPWGVARARRALAYVRDGAASPEEAVCSMVLSLPSRRGGYGLPFARLNAVVGLGAKASSLFGIDFFVCDLSWNGGVQVLEYQGSHHKLRSRQAYDRRKGNVLVADGRDVIQVDRHMLERQALMDDVAKSVTMALGRRWRAPRAEVVTSRLRLRNKLISCLDER